MEQATEIGHLQRCFNDLIGLLALPAMWTGRDPARLVGTLLDTIMPMLRLDFAYASLIAEGGAHVEMVRHPSAADPVAPRRVGQTLGSWLRGVPERWPLRVPNPLGNGDVSIVPLSLGLQDDSGVIVAGSARAGFPSDTERFLLSVAVNQAAIGLHEARLLSEQKRVASELDRRVAERTHQLAAANEELRRIVDAIPQAIIVLAPDGSTLYVNAVVLEYTGLGLEEAKSDAARGKIFHPDDLERIREERQRGLSRGEPFETELRARREDGQYRWSS